MGVDNLQFYPNFALFSTLGGGINLDLDFFQVSKSSEDRKKKSSPKIKHFFSPNSGGNLRSDAHRSQIFGGVAQMKTILKLLGGCSQIIGGIYLPIPPGFGIPAFKKVGAVSVFSGIKNEFGPNRFVFFCTLFELWWHHFA